MADSTITRYLTSYEQIQSNYSKYADKFADANAELVNSETFLNLLVAEMTNQDPLEPTSNTEFVSQMAQFTQLSYAQDSSTYAKANYAASLVGKIATASKMDGAEQVTKTGVVESVMKNGDTYTVSIGGVSFDISKVTGVKDSDGTSGGYSSSSSLGDAISRASMMIGMYATVQAQTDSGSVVDAGIIESIQVKNGEINAVINGIAYKLSDIVEVRYAEYVPEEEADPVPPVEEEETEPDNSTEPAKADNPLDDDNLKEMLDQLMADITQDADVDDLVEPDEAELI